MKITKKAQKEFIQRRLASDAIWAKNALLKIYSFQTYDEQERETTCHYNGVGFSGAHAEILSSFAKQLEKWNRLSDKQMSILFRIMPKYWRQVLQISDTEKLNSLILKSN